LFFFFPLPLPILLPKPLLQPSLSHRLFRYVLRVYPVVLELFSVMFFLLSFPLYHLSRSFSCTLFSLTPSGPPVSALFYLSISLPPSRFVFSKSPCALVYPGHVTPTPSLPCFLFCVVWEFSLFFFLFLSSPYGGAVRLLCFPYLVFSVYFLSLVLCFFVPHFLSAFPLLSFGVVSPLKIVPLTSPSPFPFASVTVKAHCVLLLSWQGFGWSLLFCFFCFYLGNTLPRIFFPFFSSYL